MLTGLLGSRSPDDVLRRFTESANTTDHQVMSTSHFFDWYTDRKHANKYRIQTVPFDRLDGWHFQESTGNLVHRSGKFFSIEGLEVSAAHREISQWAQPIIVQPEFGILGIIVKEFNGVLHCLMQAKMEPGNINTVQLSPTIQATRSNYSRVHNGNAPAYLEYFLAPRRGRVLVDALQSEQGCWFLGKRNRNMVVEVTEDVPVLDDFCWLSLGQIHELLQVNNLVNMDSRTVLSGIPFAAPVDRPSLLAEDSFRGALLRSLGEVASALHDPAYLLSWFTEAKARHRISRRLIPLPDVPGWKQTDEQILHGEGRYFTVLGVDVEASNREVSHWTQPMLAPAGRGLVAFVVKQIGGVLHILVQARSEAGTLDVVEMAPTVQCNPGNLRDGVRRPEFLDHVLSAPPSAVRHDVVYSEEGGRFYHAENRYVVVEAGAEFPVEVPEDYVWMTACQARELIRYGGHFNVEARTLLACLHSLWAA